MKVIVLVDQYGNTQTLVRGVAGSSCLQATKFLEGKLGIVTEDVLTEEYYSAGNVQQEVMGNVETGTIKQRQVNRIY